MAFCPFTILLPVVCGLIAGTPQPVIEEQKIMRQEPFKLAFTFKKYTVLGKSLRPLVFSLIKDYYKSVIQLFTCSASVENINVHFQTLFFAINCNNPV